MTGLLSPGPEGYYQRGARVYGHEEYRLLVRLYWPDSEPVWRWWT